jgi:hypothetical protein
MALTIGHTPGPEGGGEYVGLCGVIMSHDFLQ